MAFGFLALGFLCGLTAAVLVFSTGAGILAALLAYAGVGAAGVLLFAVFGGLHLTTPTQRPVQEQ